MKQRIYQLLRKPRLKMKLGQMRYGNPIRHPLERMCVCVHASPIKQASPCGLNGAVHVPNGLLDGRADKRVPFSTDWKDCGDTQEESSSGF